MFADLTHDAVSLSSANSNTCSCPCSSGACSTGVCSSGPCSSGASSQAAAFKVPEVVHITGSTGVQIGPTYYISSPPASSSIPSSSNGGEDGDRPDPRPPREHVLRMLAVSREVSCMDKRTVSEHLGSRWRQLGREMGYSSGQLDNIDDDNRRTQDKVHQLLQLWHDKESGQATFAQLTRLLMRIRAFEVVMNLQA